MQSEAAENSGQDHPELPHAPWSLSPDETAEHLCVSTREGLTEEEVRRRRESFGPNRLQQQKQVSAWTILIDQFKDLIIILLGVASAAAFLFGEWLEGVAVAVALVINGAIGFFTELKATRSMEALHKLGETRARARRDGRSAEISADDLVPGDIVLIDAGDLVPADLRLLESNNLQADESALTGESVPANKGTEPLEGDIPLAERSNMLFRGTAVTTGSGSGIVTATAMKTELGNVADLTQGAEEEATPLERRLERLGYRLIALTFLMGVIVAAAGLIGGRDMALVLKTAIAMAIAAVPEGLPVVATIALARGMWRMARRNALMNRLSAVETLGATTIIFTDKTGTLTENRMTVRQIALPEGNIELTEEEFLLDGEKVDPSENEHLRQALEVGVLCNNASLDEEGEIGDPMETALLRAGRVAGIERQRLLNENPEIREEAFSTEAKMMSTFHEQAGGFLVAVKGAPEAVLEVCSRVAAEGGEKEFGEEDRSKWLKRNRDLAEGGLRLLALARKEAASEDEEPYRDLTLLGFAGLLDPPRKDVQGALEECGKAGIRVIMVTGDQPATALGIAAAIALESEESHTLRGESLRKPEELSAGDREKILGASIFARVTPEQKLSLIALHQENGEIVAMTGDGVNDAPALKKADIGIAMGQRGTQVAKEAADMVLKDDRFSTIVAAVRYGRAIFNNIRKFIFYLISGNVSEVLIITLATVAGAPLPLLPLQILYINLIGDVFPALALGMGEATSGIMERPPRDPKEPVLTRSHWLGIGGYSLVFTAAVLGAFAVALYLFELSAERAVTVSFTSLVLARLWHVFNMRDPGTALLRNEITTNPYVWGALALGLAMLLGAVYLPILAGVLGLTPPDGREWLLILTASLVPLAVGQAVKLRSTLSQTPVRPVS
jgi:Ca2+-transporting ATPase